MERVEQKIPDPEAAARKEPFLMAARRFLFPFLNRLMGIKDDKSQGEKGAKDDRD